MSWRSLHRMESSFPRIQISPTGPLPFQDDTFDLILAIFVLHFTLPPSTLMDLARVSCGYFVGTVYGTRSERLESMLADAGFSVLTYVESRHARGHFIFSATTDAS